MALLMFGGRDFDPLEFGNVWDPLSGLNNSVASRNAHAVSNTQIDWHETLEAHIFEADLPGMKQGNLKVQVLERTTLEISGVREVELQMGDTWHRMERVSGSFLRRFQLPENSNVDKAQAQVVDGVLTVTIPKVEKPEPEEGRIEIA